MSFIDDIINAFSKNQENMSKVQGTRFIELMNQFTGPIMADRMKKGKRPMSQKEEEFWATTLSYEVAGLTIQDDMDAEEKALTQQCIGLYDIMGDTSIPSGERHNAAIQLRKVYPKLGEIRKRHDEAIRYNGTTTEKAELIIRNCKTQYFSSGPSKRTPNKYDRGVAGIDDPFYDTMKELYGEEGLLGYRKERAEAFKKIPLDRVKLASQRYKKVEGVIEKARNLLEIPILLGAYQLYPNIAPGMNPIAYGLIVYMATTAIIMTKSMLREGFNQKVFEARHRIATDLGLIKKDYRSV